jgi:glucosyl-dolichyl phosphate glucuronosyltransferase
MTARVTSAPEPGSADTSSITTCDATVVLATYDLRRLPSLVTAVESLLADSAQPGHVVVAVDHNEELYERIHAMWPQVTVIVNRLRRGASATRNVGARLARTPFIAFIDDDIRIHEGWLSALLQPFADPAVVGTGGRVVAGWQSGRPRWFPEEFDWVVGASYRGMPTEQSSVRNVWSENMAVRAQVFRGVDGFRTEFGKVGSRNSPEDTDLCIRMTASVAGAKWVYVPAAVAEHHVPASRASFTYFLGRNYLEGCGKLEMAQLLGSQEKLESEREYLRRTLPAGIAAGLRAAVWHSRISGLLKAGAIVAGIFAAGIGAVSEMRNFSRRRRGNSAPVIVEGGECR